MASSSRRLRAFSPYNGGEATLVPLHLFGELTVAGLTNSPAALDRGFQAPHSGVATFV
jgi:hypothetical protein